MNIIKIIIHKYLLRILIILLIEDNAVSLNNVRKTTGELLGLVDNLGRFYFCHCHFYGPKFIIRNKLLKFQKLLKIKLDIKKKSTHPSSKQLKWFILRGKIFEFPKQYVAKSKVPYFRVLQQKEVGLSGPKQERIRKQEILHLHCLGPVPTQAWEGTE